MESSWLEKSLLRKTNRWRKPRRCCEICCCVLSGSRTTSVRIRFSSHCTSGYFCMSGPIPKLPTWQCLWWLSWLAKVFYGNAWCWRLSPHSHGWFGMRPPTVLRRRHVPRWSLWRSTALEQRRGSLHETIRQTEHETNWNLAESGSFISFIQTLWCGTSCWS